MQLANVSQNLIIGHPLLHSQSPALHNYVYEMLGLNTVFLAKSSNDLDSLIINIKNSANKLIAVTIPFKEKVLAYLDACEPEVDAMHAANTILQVDGKLFGYNTDIFGLSFACRNYNFNCKEVLVLGAGGAARAVGYFLNLHNAKIIWCNRTLFKAQKLAQQFGGIVISLKQVNEINPDVIINCTPLGSYPKPDITPLPNYKFKTHQLIFDMVYNPCLTSLLKQASACGCKVINGMEMFISQGLRQIELFTNRNLIKPFLIKKLTNYLLQQQSFNHELCNN